MGILKGAIGSRSLRRLSWEGRHGNIMSGAIKVEAWGMGKGAWRYDRRDYKVEA